MNTIDNKLQTALYAFYTHDPVWEISTTHHLVEENLFFSYTCQKSYSINGHKEKRQPKDDDGYVEFKCSIIIRENKAKQKKNTGFASDCLK